MLIGADEGTRERLLARVNEVRQWLLNELYSLTFDRQGCSIADVEPVPLQRAFVRRVPEVCGLLAPTLLEAPQYDAGILAEYFVEHPWFRLPSLRAPAEALEQVLLDYVPLLHDWAEWEVIDLDPLDEGGLRLQPYRRLSDKRYVADFVGLAKPPPAVDPMYQYFLQDAEQARIDLEDEYSCCFIALRTLTPSPYGLEIGWLPGRDASDDSVDALIGDGLDGRP